MPHSRQVACVCSWGLSLTWSVSSRSFFHCLLYHKKRRLSTQSDECHDSFFKKRERHLCRQTIAVCCSAPTLKIEVTLDCGCKRAIKGHFCSFLVSNIFLNPLFLLSAPCSRILRAKHCFFLSQARIPSVFSCFVSVAKGEFFLLFREGDRLMRTLIRGLACSFIYIHFAWTDLNVFRPWGTVISISRISSYLYIYRPLFLTRTLFKPFLLWVRRLPSVGRVGLFSTLDCTSFLLCTLIIA
jgi:hypothetical protein